MDVFRVGLGDAERDRRVSEVGWDADKDLASTTKLRPCCTQCSYLKAESDREKEVETEVDIQTEVTGRHT